MGYGLEEFFIFSASNHNIFLSVPSQMFMHTFGNMLSCTLVFPYDLFNVIMVANFIILPIKKISPMVFFFAFLAPIHPLKTTKLNILFIPLMTFFTHCSFRLPFHLVFGLKLYGLPAIFLTSTPLNFDLYTHCFNPSLLTISYCFS
jgi:hypothetical protein